MEATAFSTEALSGVQVTGGKEQSRAKEPRVYDDLDVDDDTSEVAGRDDDEMSSIGQLSGLSVSLSNTEVATPPTADRARRSIIDRGRKSVDRARSSVSDPFTP